MILSTTCKSCGNNIESNYIVSDRMSMVKAYGEELSIICISCGDEVAYHVDEFTAERNIKFYHILLIIAGSLSAAIALFIFLFFSINDVLGRIIALIIVLIPCMLLLVYLKFDTENQSEFNRRKLRGRVIDSKLTSTSSKVDIAKVSNTKSAMSGLRKHNNANLPSNKKKDSGI